MIEKHYLELMTVDGFISRYWQMIGDYPTCIETYEAVERQHEFAFHKRKYSDYQTFAVTLTRWNKKKKDKVINRESRN